MAKVWKFLRKTSMVEFLSVKLQTYSVQDCNFAIKITHHRYFFENVPNTSFLKKPYFEKKSL